MDEDAATDNPVREPLAAEQPDGSPEAGGPPGSETGEASGAQAPDPGDAAGAHAPDPGEAWGVKPPSLGEEAGAHAPSLGEEDVMDALSNVIDPELGLDFVELGLIYGVEISEGNVHVTFTLTTPGCPIGPQVNEQIEEFVGEVEGVRTVSSEMVFMPAWSPEMMSEDARFALGF